VNTHETGILRGLIQAFLAITKTSVSTPKTTTQTSSESVLALVVQVAQEILTKIESMEAASAQAASHAIPTPTPPSSL
jgi:hypothetical protein